MGRVLGLLGLQISWAVLCCDHLCSAKLWSWCIPKAGWVHSWVLNADGCGGESQAWAFSAWHYSGTSHMPPNTDQHFWVSIGLSRCNPPAVDLNTAGLLEKKSHILGKMGDCILIQRILSFIVVKAIHFWGWCIFHSLMGIMTRASSSWVYLNPPLWGPLFANSRGIHHPKDFRNFWFIYGLESPEIYLEPPKSSLWGQVSTVPPVQVMGLEGTTEDWTCPEKLTSKLGRM